MSKHQSRKGGSIVNRQGADADSCLLENDYASALQGFTDRGQVRKQKCQLSFRPPFRAAPEENERRFAVLPCGQERAEIGVGGNNNTTLGHCALKNQQVIGPLHVIITNVSSIMPFLMQPLGEHWRERIVDEKLQAGVSKGSSRSRTDSAANRNASRISSPSKSG